MLNENIIQEKKPSKLFSQRRALHSLLNLVFLQNMGIKRFEQINKINKKNFAISHIIYSIVFSRVLFVVYLSCNIILFDFNRNIL